MIRTKPLPKLTLKLSLLNFLIIGLAGKAGSDSIELRKELYASGVDITAAAFFMAMGRLEERDLVFSRHAKAPKSAKQTGCRKELTYYQATILGRKAWKEFDESVRAREFKV